MTTAQESIVNVVCQPNFDAESMPFSDTQTIAQSYFGSSHKVELPYLGAGSGQVRFDVITADPDAVKAVVAASRRYQLR